MDRFLKALVVGSTPHVLELLRRGLGFLNNTFSLVERAFTDVAQEIEKKE